MNQNLFALFRANRTISIIFYTVMIVVGIAGVAATEMGLIPDLHDLRLRLEGLKMPFAQQINLLRSALTPSKPRSRPDRT